MGFAPSYDRWLEKHRHEVRAFKECERCQGRRFGDCSPQCRYFWETASDAEEEAACRASEDVKPLPGKKTYYDAYPTAPERISQG